MMDVEEPAWKKLKLSLERPWKNDAGEPIAVLEDIDENGRHIYEQKPDPSGSLGESIKRIFVEKGVDYFEKEARLRRQQEKRKEDAFDEPTQEEQKPGDHEHMTADELLQMRGELQMHLNAAAAQMFQAREVLSFLLQSAPPPSNPSTSITPAVPAVPPSAPRFSLAGTSVTKPPPIPSLQTFDEQLAVGGKDESLRAAADIFKSAAESVDVGLARGNQYWIDALKLRKANWGLVPAPLPFGSALSKGTDKSSKDFLITFGLEESPPGYRRRAIGHMPTFENSSETLILPYRQRTRLRVSLVTIDDAGVKHVSCNTMKKDTAQTMEDLLKTAQREIVEEEIFSSMVREAGRLPTTPALVNERVIKVEAAQGVEVHFELVKLDEVEEDEPSSNAESAKCDLIHAVVHILLLRAHSRTKARRLNGVISNHNAPLPPAPILQPVIDILQFEAFCKMIATEFNKIVHALSSAGIACTLRLKAVGDSGEALLKLLDDDNSDLRIGGEAILRVDDHATLRLTFLSPSSLTVHLPQAAITVATVGRLHQLLADEIEHCLLGRICEIGTDLSSNAKGVWFVDTVASRCVGRWEGRILNFRITFDKNYSISCSAYRLDNMPKPPARPVEVYHAQGTEGPSFLSWVHRTISEALSR